MEVFKKMWPEAWGVRMEHILRNVLMALLEQPTATMHDVLRIFWDKEFRKRIAESIQNPTVRRFFEHEYEKFAPGYRADASAPIQNKVGAFLADPLLNRMLTAPKGRCASVRPWIKAKYSSQTLQRAGSARTAPHFSEAFCSQRWVSQPTPAQTLRARGDVISLSISMNFKASRP
jgi:hypothetical protein